MHCRPHHNNYTHTHTTTLLWQQRRATIRQHAQHFKAASGLSAVAADAAAAQVMKVGRVNRHSMDPTTAQVCTFVCTACPPSWHPGAGATDAHHALHTVPPVKMVAAYA